MFGILFAIIICVAGGFVITLLTGVIANEEIEWRTGSLIMFLSAIAFVVTAGGLMAGAEMGRLGLYLALLVGGTVCALLVKHQTKANWGQSAIVGGSSMVVFYFTALALGSLISGGG